MRPFDTVNSFCSGRMECLLEYTNLSPLLLSHEVERGGGVSLIKELPRDVSVSGQCNLGVDNKCAPFLNVNMCYFLSQEKIKLS